MKLQCFDERQLAFNFEELPSQEEKKVLEVNHTSCVLSIAKHLKVKEKDKITETYKSILALSAHIYIS
ncbi:MAG: hypothetical protein JNM06_10590 [Blastocatellia bacterium]|nr:hypothetical protein [Blastocatellia bacterium]